MQDSRKDKSEKDEDKDLPGYLHYPESEDIFTQEERILSDRVGQEEEEEKRARSLDEGLDVPGSELDDAQEEIGSEDEENNYYSLGGDNHEDLEQSDDI
ncbi:hypothetical protein FXV77_16115 [Sphingobacterium phlebotomi]|uniref:Uncharacterized protein n=1 Tax=Sphingobacterium phlebotomi TaxID=2605433 RepID=A0A5D4H0Y7_9SPHI|nr:hypothetical protein [Sphingobacterium phlebotomi]TYR34144.1 hypothetical protein FXV77_16115 [Sphingobacterium phlebotomi]